MVGFKKGALLEGAFFMNLTVNGRTTTVDDALTLDDLIRAAGADPGRVAVLHNRIVVPGDRRREVRLRENDCIEIVTFAGGG